MPIVEIGWNDHNKSSKETYKSPPFRETSACLSCLLFSGIEQAVLDLI